MLCRGDDFPEHCPPGGLPPWMMRREWVWGWACVLGAVMGCGVDAGLELRYPTDGAIVYLPQSGHELVVEVTAPSIGYRSACVVLDGGWVCEQGVEHDPPRSITLRWPWPLTPGPHLLYAEALDGECSTPGAKPSRSGGESQTCKHLDGGYYAEWGR